MDKPNWLLLIHELGHVWHRQMVSKRDERGHGRTHRKLVNRLARYVLKQGWHTGTIAAKVQAIQARRIVAESAKRQPPTRAGQD